ncbi:MAG: DUF5916 domain-containing protein [Myxococcales bacterium]|nr:DUF5916 domain-containing protein [Myxococcales bacterium]
MAVSGRLLALGALVFGMVVSAFSAHAQPAPKRVIALPRGDAKLELDGRLDEPIWARAQPAKDFVERGPVPGATPPVSTTARVLYDRETIYVGLRANLFSGEVPRADTLARDVTRVWSDESFTIKFDVRHDRRTTVAFAINPRGAQLDGIAVENGRVFRREYDAVWRVATHVDEGYWSAEVEIPVVSLGLTAVDGERVLGFNVARDHNSRVADYDWSHLPPEFGPWAATHYGELHGVRDIATGQPLTLLPFVRWGYPEDPEDDFVAGFKAGGDVRLRFGDATWTELTLFTDFAQVDADDQVINFDRFPLFFPERRPFFLSGTDVFEFGEPEVAQVLFTRRIGLDAARSPVPVLGGFKLYGNQGVFDYGLLQVFTDDTLRLTEDPDADPLGSPAASYSVGRARVNFATPGHVGVIVGARSNLDLPFHDEVVGVLPAPHLSLGADFLARPFGRRFEVSGFSAYTRSEPADPDEGRRQGSAHQARVRWLAQQWQPTATVCYISERFEPEVGFVRRPGTLTSEGEVPFVYRTTALGLASVSVGGKATFVHDAQVADLLTRDLAGTFQVLLKSGWQFDLTGTHSMDVVPRPFSLFKDLEIQAERYMGPSMTAMITSPTGRNPAVVLAYDLDAGFFSGVRHAITPMAALSLGPHVRLTASGTFSLLKLRDCVDGLDDDGLPQVECGGLGGMAAAMSAFHENRKTLTVNSGISVTPTTRLSADVTLQLNTSERAGLGLFRLRYRYLPGSDVFLVYQENLDYSDGTQSDRRVIVKLAYRHDDML